MSDRTKNANFKDNAETGDVAYVVAPSQIGENPALSAGFSFSLAFGIRQRAHACGTIAIDKEHCERNMNDYGWDKRLNIKTMGRSDINEDYNHFAYEPTAYSVLLRLAERGYITEDNTLIDYGSGKGRVSFFLSHRTGCRAVGVEYDGDLIDIAVQNLRDYRGDRGKITFAHSDAEHFTLPPEADRFYFFNPFSIKILYPVLERIYASYCEEPRQMYLFFYYPSEEYISHIMREDRLMFVDEIETADLFPGEDVRERIMVFTLSA